MTKPKQLGRKNDDSRGTYNTNRKTEFETSMLKSNLCDYNDAYILVEGYIKVPTTSGATATTNHGNRKVVFKNCAPFTDCISEIKNVQVDNAKDIDIVIPMYNLVIITQKHLEYGVTIAFNEANVTIQLILKKK